MPCNMFAYQDIESIVDTQQTEKMRTGLFKITHATQGSLQVAHKARMSHKHA